MKNKKKWISKAAVSLSLLTMFGGVAVSAGSSAVYAAQTISTNPTSDDATARSITLWKYEIKSGAELGERGDGLELSGTAPELAGKTVMEDVWFEIVRVKPNAGKELTDPLKQKKVRVMTIRSIPLSLPQQMLEKTKQKLMQMVN